MHCMTVSLAGRARLGGDGVGQAVGHLVLADARFTGVTVAEIGVGRVEQLHRGSERARSMTALEISGG